MSYLTFHIAKMKKDRRLQKKNPLSHFTCSLQSLTLTRLVEREQLSLLPMTNFNTNEKHDIQLRE